MNCELGKHIRPEGWFNWSNPANERTARYLEYNNHGEGSPTDHRVGWSKQLTKKESQTITKKTIFSLNDEWLPKE
jgi:pectinesterase